MERTDGEQLAWEARAGLIAGAAAAIAALLIFAAGIAEAALVSGDRTQATRLIALSTNEGGFLAVACVRALGYALLAVPLAYLFRVARVRRADVPRALGWFALGAPVLFAILYVVSQIVVDPSAAREFVASGPRTPRRAVEVLNDQSPLLGGLRFAAVVAFAATLVTVSVISMRVGLLSRFMGLIGVLVGLLTILPFAAPFIQLFWFLALGALLAGRWPGGRGPAWQVVEAIPWPRAAEQREEIERRRAEREAAEPASDDPDTPR